MKLRIDFTVRESDVPPEDARGLRWGDEIEVKQIFDFFNKCRDAVLTVFGQRVPKDQFKEERERLEAEIVRLKNELLTERRKPLRPDPGIPVRPRETAPWEYRPDERKRWALEQEIRRLLARAEA